MFRLWLLPVAALLAFGQCSAQDYAPPDPIFPLPLYSSRTTPDAHSWMRYHRSHWHTKILIFGDAGGFIARAGEQPLHVLIGGFRLSQPRNGFSLERYMGLTELPPKFDDLPGAVFVVPGVLANVFGIIGV